MHTLDFIQKHKLIAILRGANPADVLKIAKALYDGGIRLLEVTMNSEEPLQAIEQLSEKLGDKMLVGAGTVLDVQMVKNAVKAGAKFILSPTTDKKTIKVTKELGVVSIPGAFTPTEILKAYKSGGDVIKIFPAGNGGASYIKDVMGPLSHIPMLPTGGINLDNIKNFKSLNVVGYGLGSALVDTKREVTQQYLIELTNTARRFADAIA